MKLRIQQADPADFAALAEIYQRGRQQAFHWLAEDMFRLEDFAEHSAGEMILVARTDNGSIAGFISCWEPDDFIHMLYVERSWQRRRVGTALLRALPNWASRPYRLKCLVRNEVARSFYLGQGFLVTGEGVSPEGDYHELTKTVLP